MAGEMCGFCLAVKDLKDMSSSTLYEYMNDCIDTLFTITMDNVPCEVCTKPRNIPDMNWFCMNNIKSYILQMRDNQKECAGCSRKSSEIYCFQCKGFLCSNCSDIHKPYDKKFIKEHWNQMLEYNELKDATLEKLYNFKGSPECGEHEGEICVMVCKTCENKPFVCITCIKEGHKDHHFQDVSEAAENVKKFDDNEQAFIRKLLILQQNTIPQMRRELDIHCNRTVNDFTNIHLNDRPTLLTALNVQREFSRNKINTFIDDIMSQHQIIQSLKEFIFGLDHKWTYMQFIPRIDKLLDDLITRASPGISKCIASPCKMCSRINSTTVIRGTIACQEITKHFTCRSKNVVYVITCTNCNKLYVGETSKPLRTRIIEHFSHIKLGSGLHWHFGIGDCKDKLSVTALFQIDDVSTRRNVETALMLKLGTLKTGKCQSLPLSGLFNGLNNEVSVANFTELPSAIVDDLLCIDRKLFLGLEKVDRTPQAEE